MSLNNDMIAYKPELIKNAIIYKRKELNTKYTVRFVTNPNEQIVNQSFINIISLFDGNNCIGDIIKHLSNMYPLIKKEVFENDITNIINSLIQFQLLTIKEKNPFLRNIEVKINKDSTLILCNYTDFIQIRNSIKYITDNGIGNKYITYTDPLKYIDNYNEVQLIFESIQNNDYVFIIRSNEEIKGIIILNQIKNGIIELSYFKILRNSKYIDMAINKSITTLLKLIDGEIECVRINIGKNNYQELKVIVDNTGFERTVILKDELGENSDIIEYNHYI